MIAFFKKAAVFLLTDHRLLKIILGTLLVLIVAAVIPFAAIIGFFTGEVKIDFDSLASAYMESVDIKEFEELFSMEETLNEIEKQMKKKGLEKDAEKAQVLFLTALSDEKTDEKFVHRLVGCFEKEQNNEQLITNINEKFKTTVNVKEFTELMDKISEKGDESS